MQDQLQLSEKSFTLPFIWVPNEDSTISKVNTETGDEIGRYRIGPEGLYASPSRTTVDLEGNCWVGNRNLGTVVKVGLYEAGNWTDRNGDGICQTSEDLNGDGDITGSEILAWGEDECVLHEVSLVPGYEGTYAPNEPHVGPNYETGWQPSGGQVDGAFGFDGLGGEYADTGNYDPSGSTGQFTIATWVKWAGPTGKYQGLLGMCDEWSASGTRWFLSIDGNNSNINFGRYDSYPGFGYNSLPVGVWEHVCVTYDGTTSTMYIGGSSVGSSTVFSLGPDTDASVVFGAVYGDGGDPLFGSLDDVAVFNQALNSTEVAQLYSSGGSSFIGDSRLEGLWKLDESSGNIASDSSGKGRTATINDNYISADGYDLGHWSTSPRGLAIDADNNLWAGSYSPMMYYHIDGTSGQILESIDVSSANHTAYGAIVDSDGIIWSSNHDKGDLLRLDPNDNSFTVHPIAHFTYGLGLDYQGKLFISGYETYALSKFDTLTNTVDWTHWNMWDLWQSRGVACTEDGDIWVASTGYDQVVRYDNQGNFITFIKVGAGPTGVAVDAAGKVWVCNLYDEYIKRIDPATNTIDLEKVIVGSGGHYSYSDMTGIIARNITTKIGTWTAVHDSGTPDTPWGNISWNSNEPEGTSVVVKVRSSNDQSAWSVWETATNGLDLSSTNAGRYLQIEVTSQITSGEVSPILYDLTVLPANLPPNAICQDITVDADENCQGNAAAEDIDNGSYDPDGDEITLTMEPAGPYPLGDTIVTLTVSDGLESVTCQATITVVDATAPTITCPLDLTIECDQSTDPSNTGIATASDNCDGSPIIAYSDSVTGSCPEVIERTWTATDASNNASSCLQIITVQDTIAPVISNLNADHLLAAVGQTVAFSVAVTDDCDSNVDVQWNFGDGTVLSSVPSHAYGLPGIYTVTVTATDDCGNATSDSMIIVAYDPGSGFTTGGGWFVPDSESFIDGVNVTDTVSKANFGFIVKYKKGADNPDGNLEFQYRAGDLDLKSQDMEWLVVQSTTKVRFKGKATINGEGLYTFKVTAEDNGEPGTNDRFKIEIWLGVVDTENGPPTPKHKAQGYLGGGNIKIHTK